VTFGNYPPPKDRGAPFAFTGTEIESWPVRDGIRKINYVKAEGGANGNPAGAFGAPRGSDRKHAGVDIPARAQAPVLAVADGVVVAKQGWSGPNAKALLVEHVIGGRKVVVLYGAVAPNSSKFEIGDSVKAGEEIAKIGVYPKGSSMLHIEAYTEGTKKNYRWFSGQPAPSRLLDVTPILLVAATVDPGTSA
jgi:murein DD-endopeptidase MepM/ murein hydrolase activator NlpD